MIRFTSNSDTLSMIRFTSNSDTLSNRAIKSVSDKLSYKVFARSCRSMSVAGIKRMTTGSEAKRVILSHNTSKLRQLKCILLC